MSHNLTIFANFFIDSEERYLRMKDSLQSLKNIQTDGFVVNVRGRFFEKAIEYITQNVSPLHIFSIESPMGWFYDTEKISNRIRTEYILIWMEDHICMAPEHVNAVVNEMQKTGSEILTYTFWHGGNFLKRYSAVTQCQGDLIDWFDHTLENDLLVQSSPFGRNYIIAYPSIIKKELFDSIIVERGRELRWPKITPFDFEKAPEDIHWLPLRRANPKIELFASIDDDHGEKGSCLQSRGLYPTRFGRQSYAINTRPFFFKRLVNCRSQLNKFLSVLLNTLRLPSYCRIDYLISLCSSRTNDKACLFNINYAVADYVLARLEKIDYVFEYGSGYLTLFWIHHKKKLVSVEYDPSSYRLMQKKLPSEFSVDYRLIEPEIDFESSTCFPSSTSSTSLNGYSFRKYVTAIEEFPDEYFDVVFISGPASLSCIEHSVSKLNPGGFLIINRFDGTQYERDEVMVLAEWDRKIFSGPVPGKIDQEQTLVLTKPISNYL